MGEVFETPVSEARTEMFCRLIEDLPFEAVKAAAETYGRSGKFFPKPGDLRELVDGDVEDVAVLRWEWLVREVKRVGWVGTPAYPDAATQRASEGLFGGWRALCENLPGGGPELLGYRKQFIASFGARAREA